MRLGLPLFMRPPDTFERRHIVAQHLKRSGTRSVLDVGGEGLLQRLLPAVKCLAVNVDGSGDARYDGSTLPFPAAAFEAVVSLDTIEHLPAARRQEFVDELFHVAQKNVVLSAPFGARTQISTPGDGMN
jgi:uridine phosphorylase